MMGEIEIKGNVSTTSLGSARADRRSMRKALLTPVVCSVLASFGIFGGVASLFVGIVFVGIHAIVTSERMFDSIGTGLLIIAIPLILLGSIFLDEIEIKQ